MSEITEAIPYDAHQFYFNFVACQGTKPLWRTKTDNFFGEWHILADEWRYFLLTKTSNHKNEFHLHRSENVIKNVGAVQSSG